MSKILKSFGMAALLVALLAGTGAAQTDTTDVTGNVPQAYTIESQATVALGNFNAANWFNSTMWVDIKTTNYNVAVQAADLTSPAGDGVGKLTHMSANPLVNLTNTLRIGQAASEVGLTGANQQITAGTAVANNFTDIKVAQNIDAADLAKTAGGYSITITVSAVGA